MKRFFCVITIFAVSVLALQAAPAFAADEQDSARVSLITCYPGPDAYELYGHTMLRVQYRGADMVYNYGIFDFDADNFIYHFVKGETDYKVGGYNGAYLLMGYQRRKVVEQQLNLTPEQSMQVLRALVENARPENATYRYSYIYDNCATRPRDIVENVLGDKMHYGAMHDTLTFRQEMRRYNANYAWLQLGIDLVLGSGIDYQLDYREQMFVPMVLMQAFAEASIERDGNTEPLVSQTVILNEGSDSGDILPPTPVWLTPTPVAWALLTLTVCLSLADLRRRKVSRWLDSVIFGIAGLCGLLVFFLIFISTHPATSPNMNGLWLHPFALLPAVLIWIKKAKKLLYFYHFANFAVIILLLASWPFITQVANMAAFPLMLCLVARSASYVAIYRLQCTETKK